MIARNKFKAPRLINAEDEEETNVSSGSQEDVEKLKSKFYKRQKIDNSDQMEFNPYAKLKEAEEKPVEQEDKPGEEDEELFD